jgi:hypothetical protein
MKTRNDMERYIDHFTKQRKRIHANQELQRYSVCNPHKYLYETNEAIDTRVEGDKIATQNIKAIMARKNDYFDPTIGKCEDVTQKGVVLKYKQARIIVKVK